MKIVSTNTLLKSASFFMICFTTLLSFGSPSVSDDFIDRRITAGAKIFRALLAADADITRKVDPAGKLHLCLIYEEDRRNAQLVADTLHVREDTRIRNKEIEIDFIKGSMLVTDSHASIAGMFLTERLSNEKITALANFAKEHKIIIFSPFKGDVERGILGGIAVEAQVRPYLNVESLNVADLRLKSFFLRVSKKYEK